MKAPNHIIKKQVLDFTLDSDIGSFAFQSRMSDVFKAEVLPLIDAHCTSISGGDSEIFRLDKLEIDLGVLDKSNLAVEFKQKIDELFPRQLAEALGINQSAECTREHRLISNDFYDNRQFIVTSKSRDFELLEFFIREGRLPWWVKKGELPEIAELLAEMVATEPIKVKELLTEIADKPALVQRVLYNADKSVLEKIIALFHPQQAEDVCNKLSHDLIVTFMKCPFFSGFSPTTVRMEVWLAILDYTLKFKGTNFTRQFIEENVVRHLAKAFATDENELYSYLVKEGKTGYGTLKEISLSKHPADLKGRDDYGNGKSWPERRLDYRTKVYLQQLETVNELIEGLKFILPEKKKLLAPLTADELATILWQVSKGIDKVKNIIQNFIESTGKVSVFSLTPQELDEGCKKAIEDFEELSKRLYLTLAAVLAQKAPEVNDDLYDRARKIMVSVNQLRKAAKASEVRSEVNIFSDAEEIYLRNAGLVLLWPYLNGFFEATGLVKEKKFVSEEARERGVLLLHYLAFASKEGQEYEMTLNKILCGLDHGIPVNPCLKEISKKEMRECESLLQAVIHNWPALKSISTPALRSMFLQREGMICTRDGFQVLKVAEETYDILLDGMPWGIGTVKLPWMAQILIVEWRV